MFGYKGEKGEKPSYICEGNYPDPFSHCLVSVNSGIYILV